MKHDDDQQRPSALPPPLLPDSAPRDRLSLPELTRAAGVSARTVRYYIAEGLLPPPVAAGPRTAYAPAHLDRLRLISQLKAEYLPLKEIRRRLATLDDAAVRRHLLQAKGAPPARASPPDTASAYLDRLLGPSSLAPGSSSPGTEPAPFLAEPAPSAPGPRHSTRTHAARLDPPSEGRQGNHDPLPDPEPWRRIPLGDDAELLIRESTYRRKRDAIASLTTWAKRMLR
jgi:DNA-binding transcriptional MerR regulator